MIFSGNKINDAPLRLDLRETLINLNLKDLEYIIHNTVKNMWRNQCFRAWLCYNKALWFMIFSWCSPGRNTTSPSV